MSLYCTAEALYTHGENKVSPLNDDVVIQSSLVTNGVTELILDIKYLPGSATSRQGVQVKFSEDK